MQPTFQSCRLLVFLFSIFALISSSCFSQITLDTMQCKRSIVWLVTHRYNCPGDTEETSEEIESFGFLGRTGKDFYYYSISRSNALEDSDHTESTNQGEEENQEQSPSHVLTLFEGKNDSLLVRPVWAFGASDEAYSIETPELVETKYGSIFHAYIYSGNGGWDDGEYYLGKNGAWILLEVPNWIEQFTPKVPKSYTFCRGNKIDLKSMTFEINVFKPTDGCCCPTGGSVYAELAVQGNKIVITEIDYSDKPNE
jgi:hypothetical protein